MRRLRFLAYIGSDRTFCLQVPPDVPAAEADVIMRIPDEHELESDPEWKRFHAILETQPADRVSKEGFSLYIGEEFVTNGERQQDPS